eukprot:CAMPEP_0202686194 /NCGR_PEP_ID=MMETSP1385-20130828/1992_1 /ASSEMBLY_ACC=CAM_ASM_000861 /TAXON_ID=933848 /ORGANISM="Elphidium margaritaceum" /LENGTH=130 /DNA_ID=CAMNT_0049340721 /DNA_START=59 /DNA_END=451 /DNA_ORIENTATION=+
MGDEQSTTSNTSSQTSSLGDFSGKGSFGKAFSEAHSRGGSGHTFTYSGKLYNTNCADGGDYRKPEHQDNRPLSYHERHATGHQINAALKDSTGGVANLDWITRTGKTWSSDTDRRRQEYHQREHNKKSQK